MSCHFMSFSAVIWLNCSFTRTRSFALCSALRRKPAPPVTMLRLTAVPIMKCSLNASFSATLDSAAPAIAAMASARAAKWPGRIIEPEFKYFISGSQFYPDIFQGCPRLVHQPHGALPTVLFVGDLEHHDIDAFLQRDPALVSIEHQR